MRRLTALTIAACALGFAQAWAAPIQLDSAAWTAAAAGLSTTVEDFSGFAPGGPVPGPLVLANGSFSASVTFGPQVLPSGMFINENSTFCEDSDACLSTNVLFDDRTFSGFASGTTLWAVAEFFSLPGAVIGGVQTPPDRFRVTVVGGSGTSMFEEAEKSFWGFGDPLGLTSVTFTNLGGGLGMSNYSFDDIMTAAPASVPEPASMLLLATGVASLMVRRRSRNGA